MDFAKMKHRIVFLKPKTASENTMNEDVIGWYPYHPVKDKESNAMYVTQDGQSVFKDGVIKSFFYLAVDWGTWAHVAPMNGREYAEAQKIRAETTYNIFTRYNPNVTADMKIMYGTKIFNIVSVLNVGGDNTELKIVASEAE